MQIADGINAHLEICDIETLAEVFDIGCYNPDTMEWLEFEMSEFQNDIYKFIKWYTSKPCDYMVTFNGNGFDQQVLQFVVDNYEKWFELDGKGIAGKVYEYVQNLIDNQNYGIPLQYRETQFPVKPMDLYKIHHFDNDAKRTSWTVV